jgi:hypothetical protein
MGKKGEVTEEYKIVNIARYGRSVGYVSVFLVPVKPLEINTCAPPKEPPLEITQCFNGGQMTMVDPKAMMDAFASAMAQKQGQMRQNHDPRTLLWVMPESEFMALDWKYGTIIHLALHKIREPEPAVSSE